MGNLDTYKTVIGEAFNIKPADKVAARNFAVRSYISANIVNCTLWDNSHGHVEIANGDPVIVNGKIKTEPKKDGDGNWVNLSVGRIAVIPMDAGVDTRTETVKSNAAEDEPDVL
jgi:hypothetical protein